MSIDPSIHSCGWAVWRDRRLKKYGIVKQKSQDDWQAAGHIIGAEIYKIGKEHRVDEVFCEFPAFFGGNKGSVTASSGALVKLTWIVGFLDGLFTPEFIPFNLIPVNRWKGSLPKGIVESRIRRILGKYIKDAKKDALDAIGIGLYVYGRF